MIANKLTYEMGVQDGKEALKTQLQAVLDRFSYLYSDDSKYKKFRLEVEALLNKP